MNFELTKEQQMIRDMVREFAQAEIAPYARELDEKHEFRKESFDKMAELGLFGIPFPEQYGGSGGDTVSYALAVEEIGRACGGTGLIVCSGSKFRCYTILQFRYRRAKARILSSDGARKNIRFIRFNRTKCGI